MKVGDEVRVSNQTRVLADRFGSDVTPPSVYCGKIGVVIAKSTSRGMDWEVSFDLDVTNLSPGITFQERELELL